jgi:enamine deaminase RidA (YjgF/YER057c/UK114 family)
MVDVTYLNPPGLPPAQGLYSHAGSAPAGAKLVFIAGQLSVSRSGDLVGVGDFEAQYRQVFANMGDVLGGLGLRFRNVVKFTTLFTRAEDIDAFMRLRAETFPAYFDGTIYPPNTIHVVARLVKPEFLFEVEAVAASD